VLATRSAGGRVPVSTTADSPRLCAPERTYLAHQCLALGEGLQSDKT